MSPRAQLHGQDSNSKYSLMNFFDKYFFFNFLFEIFKHHSEQQAQMQQQEQPSMMASKQQQQQPVMTAASMSFGSIPIKRPRNDEDDYDI